MPVDIFGKDSSRVYGVQIQDGSKRQKIHKTMNSIKNIKSTTNIIFTIENLKPNKPSNHSLE
jgi:uncharacterized protein YpmB